MWWQKAKTSQEEEWKLKEYVEMKKEAKITDAMAQERERKKFGGRFDKKERPICV